MLRVSQIAAILLVPASVGFAVLGGCTIIAGIEEKEFESAVDDEGGMCGPGAAASPSCAEFKCSSGVDLTNNECACGECPRDCGGLACENSRCLVGAMVAVPQYTYYVTTNGDAVFFPALDEANQSTFIHRVEFGANGEKSPRVLAEVPGTVRVLVADCENVYFAISDVSPSTVKYVSVNADHGQPKELVPQLEFRGVSTMGIDDQFVYWSVNDGGNRGIKAWRKSTRTVENISTVKGDVSGLVSNGGFLYWSDFGAMDSPGQIFRSAVPAQGTAWNPQIVRMNAGRPQSLAVDENSVYWIDLGFNLSPRAVRKASKDPAQANGPDKPLALVNAIQPPNFPANWLAVDNLYVYLVDELAGGVGTIVRAEKNINLMKKDILADNTNSNFAFSAYSLAADKERIYFAAPANGSENRILWVSK